VCKGVPTTVHFPTAIVPGQDNAQSLMYGATIVEVEDKSLELKGLTNGIGKQACKTLLNDYLPTSASGFGNSTAVGSYNRLVGGIDDNGCILGVAGIDTDTREYLEQRAAHILQQMGFLASEYFISYLEVKHAPYPDTHVIVITISVPNRSRIIETKDLIAYRRNSKSFTKINEDERTSIRASKKTELRKRKRESELEDKANKKQRVQEDYTQPYNIFSSFVRFLFG